MAKTIVIYEGERQNPNRRGVTHIAIQAMTNPPYVWATYSVNKRSDIPEIGEDLPVIYIESARKLFEFKEGKLADIAID